MVGVVAHRGAHGDGAGENSAEAFERAVALGVTRLETDVHRTADGVLVAMHDPTLDRTTDGSGAVASCTWADIARMQVRGGGRVPRLDELLSAWPDVGWVLDAKADDTVGPLAGLLRGAPGLTAGRSGRRITVGAFDHGRLRRLRRVLPEGVATATGEWEVRALVLAARTVRSAAGPILRRMRAGVVQVPVREGRVRIVDRRFVSTCHAAGLPVEVWTVNEPDVMRELIDIGVDALITDRAELALQVVGARTDRSDDRRPR